MTKIKNWFFHTLNVQWRRPGWGLIVGSWLLIVVESLSRVWLLVTSWTAACQAPLSFTTSKNLLKFMSIESVMLPNHFILCHPPFPPALKPSQPQGLFQWIHSLHQVAKVLKLQLQHQSFQWIFRVNFLSDWLVCSPCPPRNSQESSPTSQFKSINSSALSFLHSPTLTSIHDHRKNHSLD